MEIFEVQELFISSAFADRELPFFAGPGRMRKVNLPYLHDEVDVRYWSASDREAAKRKFDPDASRRTREAVTLWERANELMRLVECEKARRSLWAWAMSKTGRQTFAAWCSLEGISVETGRRRKDRAITVIVAKTSAKLVDSHCPAACDLQGQTPAQEYEPEPLRSWQDDEINQTKSIFIADFRGAAEARKALRRQRYAARG